MAQLQLLIELRCVVCDSVLVVNGIHADDEGCFACIEPCEECSKLTQRVPDVAVRPQKYNVRHPNCGDKDCFECNPPRG